MKSKYTASILALFLGAIGIHRFYLGQPVKGLLSLLFCWTYIPLFIGLIDSLIFITISDEKFNFKYNTQNKNKQNFLMKEKLKDIKVSEMSLSSKGLYKANSIINQVTPLIPVNNLKYSIDVPKWKHKYVYSYSEINGASSEQKFFYTIFKDKFFNNIFIDLDGNTNYAFILLFDLLNEYENHKNIAKLEEQFKNLGIHYPKTESYCSSFLIQKTSTIDFGLHSNENSDTIKNSYNNVSYSRNKDSKNIIKEEKEIKNDSISNIIKILQNNKISDDLQNIQNDDSIIDITNEYYSIKNESILEKVEVPYWEHKYIYYFSEIVRASNEQKQFYSIFKNKFLNGKYLNLEGNTNYAFILLFDLLSEYENHKDIFQLENETNKLGQHYPVTKSYCDSFFKQKAKNANISTFKTESVYSYEEYWKLGNKYKEKLKLNEEEIQLLNNIYNPSNNFFNIEYCGIEIMKLYITVISVLKDKYIQEGTTIEEQFLAVADVAARKQFRYRNGSENYKYCIKTINDQFYTYIFKYCENTVREYYSHQRKINITNYGSVIEVKNEFETRINSKILEILPTLISNISQPDEATEIVLYTQNTTRWKIKFEGLTTNYNDKPKEFIDSILDLAKLNKKNPATENIFFEASKFMAKYNSESALCLYIHYLYHDLKSVTFDNKKHNKTIQKILFKTNEQLQDFEKIINELIEDKNLEKALKAVPKIYEVKRKKIQLDKTLIKEAIEQHSDTVELLNEYLKDDFEDENGIIKSQEINSEEIQIEIIPKIEVAPHSVFVSEISFTAIHTTTLQLFAKNNYSVSQSELELFAKSKGIFKNQLIESINDTCYEFLDDVLIEEEEGFYTISSDYFQKISIK